MSQTTLNVKPEHPWKLTPKDLVTDLLGALFTLLSTLVIVGFSPLKGKLGFALTLIVMAILTATVMSWIRLDRKAAVNSSTTVLVYIAASFVIMALASVLYEIIRLGAPGFSLSIFTKDMSETASDMPLTEGGLLHAVIGTAYIVIFATLIATPIGILTALYIVEVKGRFAGTVRFFVQAMSGVPSIVAGLFIFAFWMIQLGNSYSGIAGGFALTVLMIPTVARTAEEVLLLIPNDLREAGLALGATQWRTVAMVVVPAVKSGLVTAVILGVARVIGETAPILLVSGGGESVNFNPVSGPMGSIPYYVWKSFQLGGTEESSQRTWAGLLVLIIWILFLFTIARYISSRSQKR